jgi:uncharacterized protein YuzE
MEICYCTDVDAFYVTIGQGEIASTAHVSDDVMVDVESDGTVHGIEFLCTPAELTEEERAALVGRCPMAAEALAAIERLTRMST